MGLFRENPFDDHWEQQERIQNSKDTFRDIMLDKADDVSDFLAEDAERTFKAVNKPRLLGYPPRNYFWYACAARLSSIFYKSWRNDDKHL